MSAERLPFQDPGLPVGERVADLLGRMTLAEKVGQMMHAAPAIVRLGVPAYNWWNECLHGVARAGLATVFPQAIGLAATWNDTLLGRVAEAISDEARAKHHAALRQGDGAQPQDDSAQYAGLTFWSPNINIFRDPRWGRGQETYGEDPYLTARMGVAFVRGLQGAHPTYLKLVATPKHFAVHSGPEAERHVFDARVSLRALRDTYLPAFEACVREAGAASIMGAYNRVNGAPACASPLLLQTILREEWGFDGFVVSDCGASADIYARHGVVETAAEAAALAVEAGCDLNCGETYQALVAAVERGLLPEAQVDQAVTRLLTARFRLGMFDPESENPYAQIPAEVVDSPAHRELALQAARESTVLLKNDGGLLPLSKKVKSVAVIGPNADDATVLFGNYHGTPSEAVTVLAGVRGKLAPGATLLYSRGCDVLRADRSEFEAAVAAAQKADVVIFVGGLSQRVEGEEGQREGVANGVSQGDRAELGLPGVQDALLQAVHATGTPLVLVLLNGSPLALPWAKEAVPAIVEAWYPGQAGGTAVADVLFGDYNPAGRLPVTFYKSVDDLPDFADYELGGHTYRRFQAEPLFPFGYGLSYTRFAYRNLQLSATTIIPGETVTVQVDVENVGRVAGDEVVQLYVSDVAASVPVDIRRLQGFRRLHLQPGERQTVRFELQPRQMALVNEQGQYVIEPGGFEVTVGGRQPTYEDYVDGADAVLVANFEVKGGVTAVA
ncbi:MAG: glycoside hydrolase family 3 C-terminal domain-containing protein [Anaerolineales bacterium]|nr:glycoside hydrolase family 3 C-terminal domain-containing protein [Anaerolineales bacterium]